MRLPPIRKSGLWAIAGLCLFVAFILALVATSNASLQLLIWLVACGLLLVAGALLFVFTPKVEARALVDEAHKLIEAGDFKLALDRLDQAVNHAPNLYSAYVGRSAAYAGMGLIDLAVEDVERAVRCAPGQPEARLARARLFSHRGLYDDAIRDLNIGLQNRPNWATGYMELAQLQVRLEDYESGLATLRDLSDHIHSDPVRYDALIMTGWVYEEKLNNLDNAIAAYTRAIPLLPDRKIGYLRRANAYRNRGDLYQAAEDLLNAARRSPTPEDKGQYYWTQAGCYIGRYRITQDVEDFRAWVTSLERSAKEDDPSFSEQARELLKVVYEKQEEADTLNRFMSGPPAPQIFPN